MWLLGQHEALYWTPIQAVGLIIEMALVTVILLWLIFCDPCCELVGAALCASTFSYLLAMLVRLLGLVVLSAVEAW